MLYKKVKEQWIAALRSGKYKQGVEALKRVFQPGAQPEYCCLGVLAECLAASGEAKVVFGEPGKGAVGRVPVKVDGQVRQGDECGFLPLNVMDLAAQSKLATMNDDEAYDFESLADYIEKYL